MDTQELLERYANKLVKELARASDLLGVNNKTANEKATKVAKELEKVIGKLGDRQIPIYETNDRELIL